MSDTINLRGGKKIIKVTAGLRDPNAAYISISDEEGTTIQLSATGSHTEDTNIKLEKHPDISDNKSHPNTEDTEDTPNHIEANIIHLDHQINTSKNIMSTLINYVCKVIPQFDGTPSEVHRFISCCDVVYKLATTPEEKTQFVELLKIKTGGKAYDVLCYKNFTTYDELRKEFQIQFLPRKTMTQLQSELNLIKQLPTENVSTYSNRVEQLLSHINSACLVHTGKTTLSEDLLNSNYLSALQAFQEGLREPIKTLIKASRLPTLREAIAIATNEEAKTPQSSTIRCNACGKMGHLSKDCRISARGFHARPSQSSSNQHYSNQSQHYSNQYTTKPPQRVQQISIQCRYCKNKGHSIEECRKRQFRNQITSQPTGNSRPRDSSSTETPAQTHQ